jgi:N-acetylmuramic acid 6-phosphate etherase
VSSTFPTAQGSSHERGHLLTEQANPNSQNLDQLSSLELVELFNREDEKCLLPLLLSKPIWLEQLTARLKLYATADGYSMSEREQVGGSACWMPLNVRPHFVLPGIDSGNYCGWGSRFGKSSEDLEDRAEDGDAAIGDAKLLIWMLW